MNGEQTCNPTSVDKTAIPTVSYLYPHAMFLGAAWCIPLLITMSNATRTVIKKRELKTSSANTGMLPYCHAVSQHTYTSKNTNATLKCYALHSYKRPIVWIPTIHMLNAVQVSNKITHKENNIYFILYKRLSNIHNGNYSAILCFRADPLRSTPMRH